MDRESLSEIIEDIQNTKCANMRTRISVQLFSFVIYMLASIVLSIASCFVFLYEGEQLTFYMYAFASYMFGRNSLIAYRDYKKYKEELLMLFLEGYKKK